jgi:hypothetical protein
MEYVYGSMGPWSMGLWLIKRSDESNLWMRKQVAEI